MDLVSEHSPEKLLKFAAKEILHDSEASFITVCTFSKENHTITHFYPLAKPDIAIAKGNPRLPAAASLPDIDSPLIQTLLKERKWIKKTSLSTEERKDLALPAELSLAECLIIPLMTETLYGFLTLIKEEKEDTNDVLKKTDTVVLEAMVQQLAKMYENTLLFSVLQKHTVDLQVERDVHKKIEFNLSADKSIFKHFSDNIADVFWVLSPDLKIVYMSPAFEEIWGKSLNDLYLNPGLWTMGIEESDREGVKDKLQKMLKMKKSISMEYRVQRPDGTQRYVYDRGFPITDKDGTITHIIGITTDITSRKISEKQLERMAHYDVLTGLANRSVLFEVIHEAINNARLKDKKIAILFLDLDGFKQINDKYGHEVGDEFLKIVGDRLRARVRKPDVVIRLGGDEFVIILPDIIKTETVTTVAKKIIDAISRPFLIKDHEFSITTSIGISLYPDDGSNGQTLLSKADIAMYESKENGGNGYQFCTLEMSRLANEKIELEKKMRWGLENEEFVLIYQPKIEFKSNTWVGVEAFLYWKREGDLIPPREFLQTAEESGLIIPLGEWVLQKACEQMKRWHTQGLPLSISVNLSSHQFILNELLNSLARILRRTELSPKYLELELTEAMIMKNEDISVSLLRALKAMHIQLAIDDFGTGYSSVMHLKQFRVDHLKIDQSFIQGIPRNHNDVAIVKAIIAMAHSLGLKVVAEGIETQGQYEFLIKEGCDEGQGFYLARPCLAEQMTPILQNPPLLH